MRSYCGDISKYQEYMAGYPKIDKCPYVDPDTLRNKGSEFYKNLTLFLNCREAMMCKNLNERWMYEFIPLNGEKYNYNRCPDSIQVTKLSGTGNLYLRSDQFGFLVPKSNYNSWHCPRYPYANYLKLSDNEERNENVAKWIWKTRTIGGSFLWPIQQAGKWKSIYNLRRGIGCKNRGWCYIQDRVDLTLFEVMHYYEHLRIYSYFVEEKYEWTTDVLFDELSKNPNMRDWLNHFGSFETFVKFFMFEDFVCKDKTGKLVPKNIVESKENAACPLTDEYVNFVKSKRGVIQNLSVDDVENMLNNVSGWIVRRSERIEEELSKAENGIDCNT